MKALIDRLRPAFDEILVYPCAFVGVVISPVVVTAATGERPHLAAHWWDLATSLVVTAAILMAFEMRGTAEGKKATAARWRRYGFAFFAGLAWRQVVPAVINVAVRLIEGIGG